MRTRKEIEAEAAKCLQTNPAEATRVAYLERSLGETLQLMELIEELTRMVPITVGIANRNIVNRRDSHLG